MAHRRLFLIVLMILVGLLLGCSGETESDEDETYIEEEGSRALYVFGDSWADAIDDGAMQAELVERDYDGSVEVIPFGIGGTTMAQWGNDEEGITSELIEAIIVDPNPDPIAFFTLGGNDLLDTGSADTIPDDLRRLLTMLEGSRDDLEIVFAQYDILNPSIEPRVCAGLFENAVGTSDATELNRLWIDLFAESAAVAAEFERVTAVNTYGTLQGQPGSPDPSSWSSADYLVDCIHLNDEGYGVYLDTVFDEGLTPLIE